MSMCDGNMIDHIQCIKNTRELFDETSAAISAAIFRAIQIYSVNYQRFLILLFP